MEERERGKNGGKLKIFFCSVFEFLTDAHVARFVTPFLLPLDDVINSASSSSSSFRSDDLVDNFFSCSCSSFRATSHEACG